MLELNTVYSGKEFNGLCKNKKFYKFLNDNSTHNNFQYKLGLNIDSEPFNPDSECSKGGLYFCEESECYRFWDSFGKHLAIVEIPDDAKVYVEQGKFKADKIILTKTMDFDDVADELWISMLEKNLDAFKFMKNPSYEVCKYAIGKNYKLIRYVDGPLSLMTEELCALAVKQNGLVLKHVLGQFKTDYVCTLAVKQNGLALRYVHEDKQTYEMCFLAVKQNILALQYVQMFNWMIIIFVIIFTCVYSGCF